MQLKRLKEQLAGIRMSVALFKQQFLATLWSTSTTKTKRWLILQCLTAQRGHRMACVRGGDEFGDGFYYIPAGREDSGIEREESEYKAPDEYSR
jgi:hypothetical protein